MAYDPTAILGSLDLFELLVNNVFGNVLVSILGVAAIMFVTGVMGRLSVNSIIIIISSFLLVATIGYFGSIPAILALLFAAYYFISGLINWIQSLQT